MQRKAFDKLASGFGAVLVVILLVAGGLLVWGQSFATSNVHDQLAQQQISFRPRPRSMPSRRSTPRAARRPSPILNSRTPS